MKCKNGINITDLGDGNFTDEAFKEGPMTDDRDFLHMQINYLLETRFVSKEAVLEVYNFIRLKIRTAYLASKNGCGAPVKRCGYNRKAHKSAIVAGS